MRPHNAGRPQPGDQVYIITTPRYLPLLDRLFGGHAPTAIEDPRLYGEFAIEPGARLADFADVPMPMTPTELGKLIADETEKWGKVIRAANIKAD